MLVALIEDDDRLREQTAAILRDVGFEVHAHEDVPARVRRRHDVIVLDLRLRDSDGDETLVRCKRAFGPVPIIVWTGDSTQHTRAIAEGAEWCVVKGQPLAVLVNAIEQVHARATRLFDLEGLRAARDRLEEDLLRLVAAGG